MFSFWLMLAASVCYLIGTFGVTGLGNVPLNDQLDALNLSTISKTDLSAFRVYYESKWNRLHSIRTVFALVTFLLVALSIFAEVKKLK